MGHACRPAAPALRPARCRASLFASVVWKATAPAWFYQLLWSRSRSRCGLAGKSGAVIAV
ncbi:hypothetical protein CUJ88_17600 [Paraburkholderia hospita]|nr:hypothetical protein CUJ88_17600 [Paraburkholderia hospita]